MTYTVEFKAIDRITITLNAELIDDQVVVDLGELIDEHPGPTKLFILLRDTSGKRHVLLRSASKTVDVKNDLIQFINQSPALEYKIN